VVELLFLLPGADTLKKLLSCDTALRMSLFIVLLLVLSTLLLNDHVWVVLLEARPLPAPPNIGSCLMGAPLAPLPAPFVFFSGVVGPGRSSSKA